MPDDDWREDDERVRVSDVDSLTPRRQKQRLPRHFLDRRKRPKRRHLTTARWRRKRRKRRRRRRGRRWRSIQVEDWIGSPNLRLDLHSIAYFVNGFVALLIIFFLCSASFYCSLYHSKVWRNAQIMGKTFPDCLFWLVISFFCMSELTFMRQVLECVHIFEFPIHSAVCAISFSFISSPPLFP